MAECKGSGLSELDDEITCGMCHEHYQEPKVLHCCHYYCKTCIFSLALKTGLDKPFSCPECRKETTLPQGSVDNLKAVLFVNQLKHIHSTLQQATAEAQAKCKLCSEDNVQVYCRQCTEFLCAECTRQHKRMKTIFPDHETIPLENLTKEDIIPKPVLQKCKIHDKKMTKFCLDCNCLICSGCIKKNHNSHNCKSVNEAAPEVKKELSQHLEQLKQVKNNLKVTVEDVHITRSELKAEEDTMVQHIEKWCYDLCQIIQLHMEHLVQEADSKIEQMSKHLSSQEESLSTSCAGADSVIEFTQHCMEHSTDGEIMCISAELKSRINQEIKEHQKSRKPVEKVAVAAEVKGSEELKKLCQAKARIIQIPGGKKQPEKQNPNLYSKIN